MALTSWWPSRSSAPSSSSTLRHGEATYEFLLGANLDPRPSIPAHTDTPGKTNSDGSINVTVSGSQSNTTPT
jgi:hypothetical protein